MGPRPRDVMFDVEGFILVGGASRRMGSDKARLTLDGRTVLDRVAQELAAAVPSINLVGAREDYPVSLPNVADVHKEYGALGGIHAALSATSAAWILIVACDLPFVTSALFNRLKGFATASTDAVVPIQIDGRPQPVCGFYRPETCLPETERLISVGEHTPRALLANVRTRRV